jgi:hypothetical protein
MLCTGETLLRARRQLSLQKVGSRVAGRAPHLGRFTSEHFVGAVVDREAVLTGGLVFLAVLAERFFGFRLGRWQWFGVTITTAGLAVTGISAASEERCGRAAAPPVSPMWRARASRSAQRSCRSQPPARPVGVRGAPTGFAPGPATARLESGGLPPGVRRLAERSRVASQDPDRFGDTMSTRTIAIAAFVLVVIVIVVVFVL